MKCLNNDTIPRITFNGKAMKDDFEIADPPVSVTNIKKAHMLVKLPDGIVVKIHQWGNWKPAKAWMAFNVHINMPRFSTKICGHCGDYDANWHNDLNMYNKDGFLKDAGMGSLCDASVHCGDRLIASESFNDVEESAKKANMQQCKENEALDVSYELTDCPAEDMKEARATCEAEFEKQGKFANEETRKKSFEECLMDACLDKQFATPDAEDAKEAD